METQKTVNLLNGSDNEFSKFATRKWYIINDQNNGQNGEGNENASTITFETKVVKSNLCDYSDAYILVTGDITAENGNANTRIAFKNCAPFRRCVTHINDEYAETVENLDIIIPMYNLFEYSDNYSDSSGSLWQFKRGELSVGIINPNVTTANPASFKYKSSFFKTLTDDDNGVFKDVKIAFPLKYLSNFFRSLEMSLTNCKIHLELSCDKNCVMSTFAETTFKLISTKLYVTIVTLSTKCNVNLTKQLNEGFKRSVYWNEYKNRS